MRNMRVPPSGLEGTMNTQPPGLSPLLPLPAASSAHAACTNSGQPAVAVVLGAWKGRLVLPSRSGGWDGLEPLP